MRVIVSVGIIFVVPDGDVLIGVRAISVESSEGVECLLTQHGNNMRFKTIVTLKVGLHSVSRAFGKLGCEYTIF